MPPLLIIMETNIHTNIDTSLETNHIIDFSDRLYKIAMVAVGAIVLASLAFMYYQFNNVPQNIPHEISVSGEGRAFGKPDIALVSFAVHTQELKSQDAVNKNNEIMNRVIKAVKDLGVDDKDIQTTSYYLTPIYDYPKVLLPARDIGSGAIYPSYIDQGRVFSGYSLDQQIAVKIRNFDNINAILDKVTSSGATNVSDLQFSIDNPEKINSEARAQAIAKAKEKLNNIVRESGLNVGKLVNVSEGYNYPQPMYGLGGAVAKDSASVAPQIQTGQLEVHSTVTLTYMVK